MNFVVYDLVLLFKTIQTDHKIGWQLSQLYLLDCLNVLLAVRALPTVMNR